MPSTKAIQSDLALEPLSALVDGHATDAELDQILAQWAQSAELRDAWVEQNRVGEFMRSPDLDASANASEFLQNFRTRLAQEPVVMAPLAAKATSVKRLTLHRRQWLGPTAVAAGFVMVVGAMVSTLAPQITSPGQGWASLDERIQLVPQDIDPVFSVAAALPAARALVASHGSAAMASPALSLVEGKAPSFSRPQRFERGLMTQARSEAWLPMPVGLPATEASFNLQRAPHSMGTLESP